MISCHPCMNETEIRLTEGAKGCLVEAYRYAVSLSSPKIDTEHLILALADDPNVAWLLEVLDISPQRVKEFVALGLIMNRVKDKDITPGPNMDAFTPSLRECLVAARESAKLDGLQQIGTERLAIGVIRQSGGIGAYPLTEDSFFSAMNRYI